MPGYYLQLKKHVSLKGVGHGRAPSLNLGLKFGSMMELDWRHVLTASDTFSI